MLLSSMYEILNIYYIFRLKNQLIHSIPIYFIQFWHFNIIHFRISRFEVSRTAVSHYIFQNTWNTFPMQFRILYLIYEIVNVFQVFYLNSETLWSVGSISRENFKFLWGFKISKIHIEESTTAKKALHLLIKIKIH